ncbi:MAG TPA: SMC-Scp complex subunit ScpB [bacterium]|nr:SMC-Scp complex subunit ScpB [bacterium]HPJ71138.1 SMC-Scp complex subunit ScpB [bacterium]HPQ66054.1 SMC-Scp complex subunit ScpB [bacterium]
MNDDERSGEETLKETAAPAAAAPDLRGVVEALLFASSEPLSSARLASLASCEEGEVSPGAVTAVIRELEAEYRELGRAFEVTRVANGYRLRTRREFAGYVQRMFNPRRYTRLSLATLETLAIIAYKQPITKLEIETIRGVGVDGVLKTLLDRELAKVVGQKEVIGRPYLYGTGERFLEHFGLSSLQDLPLVEEQEPAAPRRLSSSSDLREAAPVEEAAADEFPARDLDRQPGDEHD